METPSSTTRGVTRSQALASLNDCIISSSSTNGKQHHQQERTALIDITNDSPIVGLAMETPSSGVRKQRSSRAKSMMMTTPGSGEALLRGQVKTLLQKVEEEEAERSNVSMLMTSRPFVRPDHRGCVLAPTPSNTPPQLTNITQDGIHGGSIVIGLPVFEEKLRTCDQVVMSIESQKSVITRSLLLDFAEQSSMDDDDYEEDEVVVELLDEVCEGISKMKMKDKFKGRHTKFVYNSDDEIEREEEEGGGGVIRLKGLPTPKGKHLRFPIEEDDDA